MENEKKITRKALFPGSFDPFTAGHLNILKRALTMFDEVVVAVGINADKRGFYDNEKKLEIIREATSGLNGVTALSYDNLTVDLCHQLGIHHIVRGVRNMIDFETERSIADANSRIAPDIETVIIPTAQEYAHISSSAVRDIIRYYTREAGVRGLERSIGKVFRKVVHQNADKKKGEVKETVVTAENLADFLGVRRFTYGVAQKEPQVGQVNGLAWTEAGGDILSVEAVVFPGKGIVQRTGSLGDVMKESVEAARSVVRARAAKLGIEAKAFGETDWHIHFPEGATPKDGPSAGAAITTAIVSAMTNIPVRPDVAMTGEITLRGEVLEIGGLKEKLLAALRGGIKKVLIPESNVKDLTEIPDNVKTGMEIVPVRWIDKVLEEALVRKPEPLKAKEEANPVVATSAVTGVAVADAVSAVVH